MVPADPHRAAVDGVLHVPLSEADGDLAAVSQPADVGRLRGVHVWNSFPVVLVCGIVAGPGDVARQGEEPLATSDFRSAVAGMARVGAALAPVSIGVFAVGGIGNTAGAFGAYRGEL